MTIFDTRFLRDSVHAKAMIMQLLGMIRFTCARSEFATRIRA